jgi:hypothetical protein
VAEVNFMDDNSLIARIEAWAHDPKHACWMSRHVNDGAVAARPVTSEEVSEAERRLGLKLPVLLVRLYNEIGNGGFGPGYGLLGLLSGHDEEGKGKHAIELRDSLTETGPGYEAWSWPTQMLPVAHWGCAIYSCIDLSKEEAPVYRLDANEFVDQESAGEDRPATTKEGFAKMFRPEAPSLAAWLESWVDGKLKF